MSSEKQTRKVLIEKTPSLVGWPIESPKTGSGFPDVWLGPSAVECKCLKNWPKRPETPVVLDHELTMLQYRRLNHRWNAGWGAFVILQVRDLEWLLFTAPDSDVLMKGNEVPREQLVRRALACWQHGLVEDEITEWLSTPVKGIPVRKWDPTRKWKKV